MMQTERQKEIIDSALELISRKGIQGLTIKNLSKSIGVSEPAIYRHFDSKIDILTSILDLLKKNSSRLFESEIEFKGSSLEKIDHLFQNHFSTFVKIPSLTSVLFSEEIFRNEVSITKKISEIIEYNNGILVTIISEGQRNNEIREDIEAKDLAVMVMGTLRLFVKKWQFSDFSFDLAEEGEKITLMIKNLIEKKAPKPTSKAKLL